MFPNLSTIAQRRRKLGMTQNELATKAGLSQSLLTKIERGRVIPNYNIACNIFEILDENENSDEKRLSDIMQKNVIILDSADKAAKAIKLAKKHSLSQFPILEKNRLVGAITTDMLIGKRGSEAVRTFMKEPFPTLNSNTPINIAKNLLRQYPAIVVLHSGSVVGIVTAEDMI
ncbi:MAG: CBS domain-containing protein [Candidatus Micrarchaeota archaeon]|nr:CBS domain-containing protein [Candidatus Micrarchaeota archaeon]